MLEGAIPTMPFVPGTVDLSTVPSAAGRYGEAPIGISSSLSQGSASSIDLMTIFQSFLRDRALPADLGGIAPVAAASVFVAPACAQAGASVGVSVCGQAETTVVSSGSSVLSSPSAFPIGRTMPQLPVCTAPVPSPIAYIQPSLDLVECADYWEGDVDHSGEYEEEEYWEYPEEGTELDPPEWEQEGPELRSPEDLSQGELSDVLALLSRDIGLVAVRETRSQPPASVFRLAEKCEKSLSSSVRFSVDPAMRELFDRAGTSSTSRTNLEKSKYQPVRDESSSFLLVPTIPEDVWDRLISQGKAASVAKPFGGRVCSITDAKCKSHETLLVGIDGELRLGLRVQTLVCYVVEWLERVRLQGDSSQASEGDFTFMESLLPRLARCAFSAMARSAAVCTRARRANLLPHCAVPKEAQSRLTALPLSGGDLFAGGFQSTLVAEAARCDVFKKTSGSKLSYGEKEVVPSQRARGKGGRGGRFMGRSGGRGGTRSAPYLVPDSFSSVSGSQGNVNSSGSQGRSSARGYGRGRGGRASVRSFPRGRGRARYTRPAGKGAL